MFQLATVGGGIVNSVEYPYGTASVTMLGEEGFWKIDTYNDSGVVYKRPPRPSQ